MTFCLLFLVWALLVSFFVMRASTKYWPDSWHILRGPFLKETINDAGMPQNPILPFWLRRNSRGWKRWIEAEVCSQKPPYVFTASTLPYSRKIQSKKALQRAKVPDRLGNQPFPKSRNRSLFRSWRPMSWLTRRSFPLGVFWVALSGALSSWLSGQIRLPESRDGLLPRNWALSFRTEYF